MAFCYFRVSEETNVAEAIDTNGKNWSDRWRLVRARWARQSWHRRPVEFIQQPKQLDQLGRFVEGNSAATRSWQFEPKRSLRPWVIYFLFLIASSWFTRVFFMFHIYFFKECGCGSGTRGFESVIAWEWKFQSFDASDARLNFKFECIEEQFSWKFNPISWHKVCILIKLKFFKNKSVLDFIMLIMLCVAAWCLRPRARALVTHRWQVRLPICPPQEWGTGNRTRDTWIVKTVNVRINQQVNIAFYFIIIIFLIFKPKPI